MTSPTSIAEIDFNPIPGKKYWNCDTRSVKPPAYREWREEFIYFLMVDRFHDNSLRTPINTSARSTGSGTQAQLKKFCGGTLKGILDNLDYDVIPRILLTKVCRKTAYHSYKSVFLQK